MGSTCRTRTARTSWSGSRTTSSRARERAVHCHVPPQGVPPLVHGRGHGRNGVHRGRVEHERPGVGVPAVPGRDGRGGGRVRRGGGGGRAVLSSLHRAAHLRNSVACAAWLLRI